VPRKREPRLVLLGEREITLQGQSINYILKQSPRIRGIRLEIRHDSGLSVVVPKKYSQDEIKDLLTKKSRWIMRHLPGIKPVQMPLFHKEADHGDRLPYMGRQIEIVKIQGKRPSIALQGDRLVLTLDGAKQRTARILERWYRWQAEIVFSKKADNFMQQIGVRYKKILIRGQRTRWGSCSRLHNLTLNWKLLMAPEPIIDYVIVHELAHIKHMNHSKRFWDTVAKFCPRWKEHRKWLIVHEDDLKSSANFGA